jgi:hypothetical protein
MKCVCCEHEGKRRANGHIMCDKCARALNVPDKPPTKQAEPRTRKTQ